MRKFLFGLAVAIGALASIAIVFLFFMDFGRFRPQVEAAASEALGRPLEITGPFEVRVLPSPRVLVEGLALANAPWSAQETMASVDHFSARIRLFSLLFGPVVVEDLQLKGVDLLLEEGPDGKNNWTFGEGQPDQEPASPDQPAEPGRPVLLLSADLQDIKVVLRAPEEEDRVIALSSLLVREQEDAMAVTGEGDILGLALDLSGQAGPLSALREGGDAEYTLRGNLGQLLFDLEAAARSADAAGPSTRLNASFKTPAIEELLAVAGAESDIKGSWSMDASVTTTSSGADLAVESLLNDVQASANASLADPSVTFDAEVGPLDKAGALFGIGDLPPQALSVRGTAIRGEQSVRLQETLVQVGEDIAARLDGTLASGSQADLAFDINATTLAGLRPGLPALPFEASGNVDFSPSRLKIDDLSARLGDSDLSGGLDVELGEPISVRGDLRSSRLDLTPFMAEEAPEEEVPAPAAEQPPAEKVFTDEPLPLDSLRVANADLRVTVDELILRNTSAKDLQAHLTLEDGRLEVVQQLMGIQGGKAAAHAVLTASDASADLNTRVRLDGLAARVLSGPDVPAEQVPRVDVTVDLSARGRTSHELAASLTGRTLFTQGPGKIKNTLVGRVSGDIVAQLFSALNPFAAEEEFSTLDCTVLSARFVGGLGETDGFLMQTEKLQVVGSGTVDLNEERVEFEFNTKPRSGVGISADMFVTPFVKLSGPLAHPSVGLNAKGTLLTGGAAVLTGGLSFLAQGLFDRASAEADHCATTLEEVGSHLPVGEVLATESPAPPD